MKSLLFLWRKWLNVAKIIGNFQSQVIFSIFYLVLFFPLGFYLAFFKDDLKIKNFNSKLSKTNFETWNHKEESLKDARKQY